VVARHDAVSLGTAAGAGPADALPAVRVALTGSDPGVPVLAALKPSADAVNGSPAALGAPGGALPAATRGSGRPVNGTPLNGKSLNGTALNGGWH
jgi:hypothetical protein